MGSGGSGAPPRRARRSRQQAPLPQHSQSASTPSTPLTAMSYTGCPDALAMTRTARVARRARGAGGRVATTQRAVRVTCIYHLQRGGTGKQRERWHCRYCSRRLGRAAIRDAAASAWRRRRRPTRPNAPPRHQPWRSSIATYEHVSDRRQSGPPCLRVGQPTRVRSAGVTGGPQKHRWRDQRWMAMSVRAEMARESANALPRIAPAVLPFVLRLGVRAMRLSSCASTVVTGARPEDRRAPSFPLEARALSFRPACSPLSRQHRPRSAPLAAEQAGAPTRRVPLLRSAPLNMAAEAGSSAVVPVEPDVDLTVHPSGIVPQLQVAGRRRSCRPPPASPPQLRLAADSV